MTVERILLDRLFEYLDTMGNQFGFKPKLGTDMCIYSPKEINGSFSKLNGCVFSCFLDASKAFDRVKHSILFTKLLRRGAPGYIVRLLMRIRQCVLDGKVQSHRNLQCLMGSGKGEFCHRFCLIYIYIWTICLLI